MCRFIFSVVLGLLIPVIGQSVTPAAPAAPAARCFQYTWLGPLFNNESIFLNYTCSSRLTSGVPCFQPLVVSYDGTWPDVNYIFDNHQGNATCIMAPNDVCATYTYYFNGHVENSTHMCTRAVDSYDQAITSGCYTQTNGSYSTRACFCRSNSGMLPCNGGSATAYASTVSAILVVVSMLYKDLGYW